MNGYNWNSSGQKYVMLELKVVLANLLRRFQFAVRDPMEPMIDCLLETTLQPKTSVNLIVSKRALKSLWKRAIQFNFLFTAFRDGDFPTKHCFYPHLT